MEEAVHLTQRVFHNGLVKRPSKKAGKRVPDRELLGATVKGPDGRLVIVGLEDDLRTVPTDEMNVPFKEWRKALDAYTARGALQSRALAAGDDDAFDFLAEDGVVVKVLGPLRTVVDGRQGLVCLGEPTDRIGREPDAKRSKGVSASHTINGHSVILHITFGGVRFVFAGDLNEEAEESLVAEAAAGRIELEAEVLKVPHHGSADYFAGFFAAVAPVVSVVSSGDENEQKEYIHPRATLMGALGRHSRAGVDEPLVLVTELAAFFKAEGFVAPDASRTGAGFHHPEEAVLRLHPVGLRHRQGPDRRRALPRLHLQRQGRPEGGLRVQARRRPGGGRQDHEGLEGEQLADVDRQAGDEVGDEGLAWFHDDRRGVGRTVEPVDLDPVEVGPDDPVFGDAEASVQLAFADQVMAGVGQHLGHEGRWPLDVRRCHLPNVGLGQVHDVGLDGDGVSQHDVARSDEDLPDSFAADMFARTQDTSRTTMRWWRMVGAFISNSSPSMSSKRRPSSGRAA